MRWLLEDQIQDLTIGVVSIRKRLESFDPNNATNEFVWFKRMCDVFLLISLAKVFEICKEYGEDIKQFELDVYTGLKELRAEIEARKIYQYRSKYGAHIIDSETKNPLSLKEGQKLFEGIVGRNIGEYLEFYEWVYPENDFENKKCVMNTIVKTRDYLISLGFTGPRP